MKINLRSIILLFTTGILILSCGKEKGNIDPLPSWQGKSKEQIINFVETATDSTNKDYLSPNERIAVFDNDGTLWLEQPGYFQFYFVMDRIKVLAKSHPEWKNIEPYKTVINGNVEDISKLDSKAISELYNATHTGMTVGEFYRIAREWFRKAVHPVFKQSYKDLVYLPMIELLNYLQSNGFENYIVSGGGQTFIRAISDEIYGIPHERIIGTLFKTEFRYENGVAEIIRLPEVYLYNDRSEKPLSIEKFIGKVPVIAFGNSDGDLEMLEHISSGKLKNLTGIIHHTDNVREYRYDRHSNVGKLEKALDLANEKNWLIVDMAKDWKNIFPQKAEK